MNVPPKWWAKEPQNPQNHMVVMINSLTCCGIALFYPKRSNCEQCDVIWHMTVWCNLAYLMTNCMWIRLIEHNNLFHTVDGSEIPDNHLVGCMKPWKQWGKICQPQLVIAGFLNHTQPPTNPTKIATITFHAVEVKRCCFFEDLMGLVWTGMDDCVFTSMKTININQTKCRWMTHTWILRGFVIHWKKYGIWRAGIVFFLASGKSPRELVPPSVVCWQNPGATDIDEEFWWPKTFMGCPWYFADGLYPLYK